MAEELVRIGVTPSPSFCRSGSVHRQPDRREGLMTAVKMILTGALAGLCLATAVQAADYREEPYAEVEPRYHTQVIEVPQVRPFPPPFHEERTHLRSRYVEEREIGRASCR